MTRSTENSEKVSQTVRSTTRLGSNDPFWIVTDPTTESELVDICFEMTLAGLERQFRGGFTVESGTTLFSNRKAAEVEARKRLDLRDETIRLSHKTRG